MLDQAREVCPTTTRRMSREGALLVDVRERNEIDRLAFDVPDFVIMPMSEFERRYSELPRDRDLVMVCQIGVRSLKATYFLMYQGYTQVANMEGGIAKWVRKGFPVKVDAAATAAPAASSCCNSGSSAGSACSDTSASSATAACCGASASNSAACC